MGIERVANKYKKSEEQPDEVWADPEMDELRRERCMCLNCDRMNDDPPYSTCPAAADYYKACVKHDSAVMIVRCGSRDENGNLLYEPLKKE